MKIKSAMMLILAAVITTVVAGCSQQKSIEIGYRSGSIDTHLNSYHVQVVDTAGGRTAYLSPKDNSSDGLAIIGIDNDIDGQWDEIFWLSFPPVSVQGPHHYTYEHSLTIRTGGVLKTSDPTNQEALAEAIKTLDQAITESKSGRIPH